MKKKLSVVTATVLLSTALLGATKAHAQDVTVQPGDTLSGYASQYHLSVQAIEQLNHLSNDQIYAGQTLHLGNTSTSSSSSTQTSNPTTISYTIQPGDCLSTIASKFNVSVDDLKVWNQLSSDMINIGQVLQINGSGARISSYDSSQYSLVDRIINRAKDYIGVPYVWGGMSPNGFDCSGFVKYVFSKLGKSLPSRTSQGLFADGQRVSSLSTGDLVFFTTDSTGTASHVGLYIGHNRFISAINSGVRISSLSNHYWRVRYLGARSFF